MVAPGCRHKDSEIRSRLYLTTRPYSVPSQRRVRVYPIAGFMTLTTPSMTTCAVNWQAMMLSRSPPTHQILSPHLAKDVIVRGLREQFKGSAAVTIRSDTTGRPSQSETAKARNMRPEPTTILSFMDTDARAPGESLATAPATSHAPSTAPGRASGQPIVAEPATPYL